MTADRAGVLGYISTGQSILANFLEGHYTKVAQIIPSAGTFVTVAKGAGGLANVGGFLIGVGGSDKGTEGASILVNGVALGVNIVSLGAKITPQGFLISSAFNVGMHFFGKDITNAVDSIWDNATERFQQGLDNTYDDGQGNIVTDVGTAVSIKTNAQNRTSTISNHDTGKEIQTTVDEDGVLIKSKASVGNVFYEQHSDGTYVASDGVDVFLGSLNEEPSQRLTNVLETLEDAGGGSVAEQADAEALNASETASGSTDYDTSTVSQTNDDGSVTITDQDGNEEVYGPKTREQMEAAERLGINEEDGVIKITDENGDTIGGFTEENAETELNGTTYKIGNLLDDIGNAAESLTNFVTDQVESAVEWFAADDGLQLDFANWFAGNVGDIIDDNLDADEALIDFAKYVALNRLGEEIQDILSVGDAQNVAMGAVASNDNGFETMRWVG